MIAYLGQDSIKETYLNRVRAHRAADQLVKGQYWQDGKGCAVGCTIHSSQHACYETELGIPETLARLEDAIFERLPNADAMNWPEQFLNAIRVGVDLSMIWPRFALWLLEEEVIQFAGDRADVRDAIKGVASLYRRWVETGERPAQKDFEAAARAARAAAEASEAAWAAAWAARAARAARAAWAAAEAAAEAARAAAEASEAARAAGAAWKRMAAKLIELLEAA